MPSKGKKKAPHWLVEYVRSVWGWLVVLLTAIILLANSLTSGGTIDKWWTARQEKKYGKPPYAQAETVETLVQWSRNDIISRQLQRQQLINELSQKCQMGRCTPYDRQSLQNLQEAWHREQELLNRLPGGGQAQQQPNPYQRRY